VRYAATNSVSDYIEIQTPLKGYYGLVRRECRTFMSGSAFEVGGSMMRVRYVAITKMALELATSILDVWN
jgi:hypothetical protein